MLDVGGSLGVGATARMCRNRKARTTPGAWSYFKPALAATMRCDGAAQCHGFCSILVYWRLLEPFFLSAAMFFFLLLSWLASSLAYWGAKKDTCVSCNA